MQNHFWYRTNLKRI